MICPARLARPRASSSSPRALLFLCGLLAVACSRPPELPDYGPWQRFGEDPLVGRLLEQRLEAVRQAPGDLETWLALGGAFEANDFLPEARATYEAASRLGAEEPRLWYHLANTRIAAGQVEEAIPLFEKALELAPSYAPTHWRLGLAHLRRGKLEPATESFQRALDLAPNLFAAHLGLARIDLQRGEPAAAAARLEQVLQVKPGLAAAHHLLGLAYRQLGRSEEARTHLRAGIPGNPSGERKAALAAPTGLDPWQEELAGSRVSHRMLVEVAGQAFAAGDYAKAQSTLQTLREHRPDDITLILNLATVYRRVGRRAAALDLLAESLEAHPHQVRLALDLSTTHLEAGDPDKSLAAARRARDIAPDAPEPLAHEARAQLAREAPEAAEEPLRQALALAPSDPDLHLDLARVLTALGRADEAAEHEARGTALGAATRGSGSSEESSTP